MSSRTLSRLSDAAAGFAQSVEVRDGALTIRGAGEHTVVLKRRQLLRGTIADVLYYNQFDAAAQLFERADVVPGDTVAHAHSGREIRADPLEVFLTMATRAQRRMTAHVRGLEDAGLSVYAGNDPISIGIIVGAVLVAASVLVKIICDATDSEGTVCDVASFILGILGLIVGAIGCANDPENCEVVIGIDTARTQDLDGSFSFGR